MVHIIETKISQATSEGIRIRGYLLEEMIGQVSFGDLVYLLMAGELPLGYEGSMIEAMLVSCVDHGLNAPSIHTTRTVASCGVPISTAVAAGISAIGEHHGGAGAECARLLQEYLEKDRGKPVDVISENIVNDYLDSSARIPGLGHRLYKDRDPRAQKLMDLAHRWGLDGKGLALLQSIAKTWEEKTGKHLVINIDGAQGAILIDIGISWMHAKGIFLIGRSAGLNAHAVEQIAFGRPVKFAGTIQEKYTGPKSRTLP